MIKHQLPTIFGDLDHFFNVFNDCASPQCCQTPKNQPGLSIYENDGQLYIDAPLPGLKADEVEVTIDPKKRTLFIKGQQQGEKEGFRYRVKSNKNYSYAIPLADEINLDEGIEAISRDGVLTITLPKRKEGNKSLKIDVKSQ